MPSRLHTNLGNRDFPGFVCPRKTHFRVRTFPNSCWHRKSTFTSIYRSPSDNSELINEFISNLDQLLFELSSSYQASYICLDSNINSLILPQNPNHLKYFSTISENGFIQCITKATRIAGNSSSLIDHILTNSSLEEITSGTIISDVSDHFFTFLQLPFRRARTSPKFYETRNFSKANTERFRARLNELSWENVLNTTAINGCSSWLW